MNTTIVLGLGGCLDSELVLEPAQLQTLIDSYGISLMEIAQPETLDTERDLLISVLAFLRDGIGAERYVHSEDALLAFEGRFERAVTLGGTNVRAGRVLAQLGHPNILHIPGRDPEFESLLPEDSTVPPGTPPATYVPHVIVQYPEGLRLALEGGVLEARHPNRLIYVNDPVSELTPLHDGLREWITEDGVLIVSGLNSIQDEAILKERLSTLSAVLDSAPRGLRVIYEDADYHVPEFRQQVWRSLVPRTSIVGMNEDELASFTGRPIDVTDPGQIAAAVRDVLAQDLGGDLIVHTKHWALAAGPHAEDLDVALTSGTAAAGARYMFGDQADRAALATVRDAPMSAHGMNVAAALPQLLSSPAIVVPARRLAPQNPTTIGLGDTFLGGLIAGIVDSRALLPTTPVEMS